MRAYKTWVARFSGKPVGSLMDIGYISVSLAKKSLYAHRVLWFMKTGEIPIEIDHRDGDKTNNRWDNLRDVSKSKNSENSKVYQNSKTGCRGVHYYKSRDKYTAHITKNGKTKCLGYFDTPEEANAARVSAEITSGFENYRED